MNTAILIFFIVLLVALVLTAIFALRDKKEIIYKVIYTLVNEAEEQFGSKAGKRKFAFVMEQIYARLPSIIKWFITYSTLEKLIEKALAEAKEYWAERAAITDNEDIVVTGFAQDTSSNNN